MNIEGCTNTDNKLRPYEKFEQLGAEALTDEELLAVVIKSGCRGKSAVELAGEILYQDKSISGLLRLMYISEEDIRCIRGIGRVKLIQIACISELSKRIAREQAEKRLSISCPESVADYYMETLRHKSEEEVHLMLLNARNEMMKSLMISRGTATYSAVSPREVFMAALKYRASGIIMVHNHPSGDPSPSRDDIALAQNVLKLGEMMCIPLRDFMIIGDNIYTSFLEKGLLQNQ